MNILKFLFRKAIGLRNGLAGLRVARGTDLDGACAESRVHAAVLLSKGALKLLDVGRAILRNTADDFDTRARGERSVFDAEFIEVDFGFRGCVGAFNAEDATKVAHGFVSAVNTIVRIDNIIDSIRVTDKVNGGVKAASVLAINAFGELKSLRSKSVFSKERNEARIVAIKTGKIADFAHTAKGRIDVKTGINIRVARADGVGIDTVGDGLESGLANIDVRNEMANTKASFGIGGDHAKNVRELVKRAVSGEDIMVAFGGLGGAEAEFRDRKSGFVRVASFKHSLNSAFGGAINGKTIGAETMFSERLDKSSALRAFGERSKAGDNGIGKSGLNSRRNVNDTELVKFSRIFLKSGFAFENNVAKRIGSRSDRDAFREGKSFGHSEDKK